MPEKSKKEDQHQREAVLREEAALVEKQKEMAEIAGLSSKLAEKRPKREQTHKFMPVAQLKTKSWLAILKAYSAYSESNGLAVDKKSNGLSFCSREDAVLFFEAQAKAGHEFLVGECVGGKATRFYLFSCGNKQLYKGSLDDIKKQLEIACEENPDHRQIKHGLEVITKAIAEKKVTEREEAKPACPAARMRGHLQDQRKEDTAESLTKSTPPLSR
jgi:hypothetical protein